MALWRCPGVGDDGVPRYIASMSQPDFQPTLVGPTITIRPISADDWTELFAAGSDPEIWKVHPVRDRHIEAGFRKFFVVDQLLGLGHQDLIWRIDGGLRMGFKGWRGERASNERRQ